MEIIIRSNKIYSIILGFVKSLYGWCYVFWDLLAGSSPFLQMYALSLLFLLRFTTTNIRIVWLWRTKTFTSSSHRVEVRWSHENKEMSKNIYSMNWYTRLCMSLWFSGLSKYPKNKDLTVKHHIKLTGRPTDWSADRLYDRLSDCPIDRLSDWLIDRLPDLPIDRPTDRTVN